MIFIQEHNEKVISGLIFCNEVANTGEKFGDEKIVTCDRKHALLRQNLLSMRDDTSLVKRSEQKSNDTRVAPTQRV